MLKVTAHIRLPIEISIITIEEVQGQWYRRLIFSKFRPSLQTVAVKPIRSTSFDDEIARICRL